MAVKIGTYGGDGGVIRDVDPANPPLRLAGISFDVYGGRFITNFSFRYKAQCGNVLCTGPWGAFQGEPNTIDLAGEKLIKISGTVGMYHDGKNLVVTSLTFVNDDGETYGPFGNPANANSSFNIPVIDGQVIAFFGRSGEVLDALGVYVSGKRGVQIDPMTSQAVKVGPYGGGGGNKRDIDQADPPRQLVKISLDAYEPGGFITNLNFRYESINGNIVYLGPWGDFRGKTHVIDLAVYGEQLIEISGTCGMYHDNRNIVVTSLSFVTSAGKTHGPFGNPANASSSFSIPVKNGQVVSFFGNSGEVVDALGVYITA